MAKKQISVALGDFIPASTFPQLRGTLPPWLKVLELFIETGRGVVPGAAYVVAGPGGAEVRYAFMDAAKPVPRKIKRQVEKALRRSDLDDRVWGRLRHFLS